MAFYVLLLCLFDHSLCVYALFAGYVICRFCICTILLSWSETVLS